MRAASGTLLRAGRHPYLLIAVFLAAFVIATYLAAEALHAPWLVSPRSYLSGASPFVAALGVGLLAVDVFLPVPSSGVMVAMGACFGVVAGTTISVVGGVSATLLAFLVGRRGQALVDRFATADQQRRAGRTLDRFGFWGIVATRPVPVLAETVGILSGTAGALPWWKVGLAGILGNLVPAAVYAEIGSRMVSG